jgi:hypothetical protein
MQLILHREDCSRNALTGALAAEGRKQLIRQRMQLPMQLEDVANAVIMS